MTKTVSCVINYSSRSFGMTPHDLVPSDDDDEDYEEASAKSTTSEEEEENDSRWADPALIMSRV